MHALRRVAVKCPFVLNISAFAPDEPKEAPTVPATVNGIDVPDPASALENGEGNQELERPQQILPDANAIKVYSPEEETAILDDIRRLAAGILDRWSKLPVSDLLSH